MDGHIVRTFDGDILDLRMQALSMGGLAIEQVRAAVAALTTSDGSGARFVVARGPELSICARAIDDDVEALIARRQPVASDLRAVLAVGRVALDLERVGSCALRIARFAAEVQIAVSGVPHDRFHHDVRKMSRLAVAMLRDALDCFDRGDVPGADAVTARDAELDAEFHMALRNLVTYVLEDQRNLRAWLQTVFVLKALEHVGDLAAAIGIETRRQLSQAAPTAPAARLA